MIDIFSGLGVVFLFVIFFALYFRLIQRQKNKKKNDEFLIENSDKIQELLYEKNLGIRSPRAVDHLIKEILNNPDEVKVIRKSHAENLERNKEQEMELMYRNMRKVGYQYEEQIFAIFQDKSFLWEEELMGKIKSLYKLDKDDDDELLKVWCNNLLVQRLMNDSKKLRVGSILIMDNYSLDESDLTWEKWHLNRGTSMPDYEL